MKCIKCGKIIYSMPDMYKKYMSSPEKVYCAECLSDKHKIDIIAQDGEYNKGYLFDVSDETILGSRYNYFADIRVKNEDELEEIYNYIKDNLPNRKRKILFQFKFCAIDYKLFFVYIEDENKKIKINRKSCKILKYTEGKIIEMNNFPSLSEIKQNVFRSWCKGDVKYLP